MATKKFVVKYRKFDYRGFVVGEREKIFKTKREAVAYLEAMGATALEPEKKLCGLWRYPSANCNVYIYAK